MMLFVGRFLRVFRFFGLQLSLERLVLFGQIIAGGGDGLEIGPQLIVRFLKFRYLGLQLFVLLQSFRVLAGG